MMKKETKKTTMDIFLKSDTLRASGRTFKMDSRRRCRYQCVTALEDLLVRRDVEMFLICFYFRSFKKIKNGY
jgi:hypothetical protein